MAPSLEKRERLAAILAKENAKASLANKVRNGYQSWSLCNALVRWVDPLSKAARLLASDYTAFLRTALILECRLPSAVTGRAVSEFQLWQPGICKCKRKYVQNKQLEHTQSEREIHVRVHAALRRAPTFSGGRRTFGWTPLSGFLVDSHDLNPSLATRPPH